MPSRHYYHHVVTSVQGGQQQHSGSATLFVSHLHQTVGRLIIREKEMLPLDTVDDKQR